MLSSIEYPTQRLMIANRRPTRTRARCQTGARHPIERTGIILRLTDDCSPLLTLIAPVCMCRCTSSHHLMYAGRTRRALRQPRRSGEESEASRTLMCHVVEYLYENYDEAATRRVDVRTMHQPSIHPDPSPISPCISRRLPPKSSII
jgi:hypothetical protein